MRIDRETRKWLIRPWTRTDAIRSARDQRTRKALATEARYFARQTDRETNEILTGAYALAAMPLACKLS